MKPKILLSVNKNRQYYIDAVNGCGGDAVAEYCPEYSDEYDGLILCGGNDINPKFYNEQVNGAVDIDDKRDEAEYKLLERFIAENKPVMGICRGYQFINAYFGGTLHQHLCNSEIHTNKTDFYCTHAVTATEDSIYKGMYGEEFFVNSSHHQAVKNLAEGLRATLCFGDVIEGFEHVSLPIFGVQFHPERMCFSQRREDAVDGARIIKYFIDMCKRQGRLK